MSVIVDVQGFKTDDNEFIVKEIAIQCDKQVSVLLVKPPIPFHCLTKTERNQVCWIEKNRKVYWNEGYIDYSSFKYHILSLFKNKAVIFVKGLEKTNWIRKIMDDENDNKIIVCNIENYGCPNLQTLYDQYKNCPEIYNCIYHSSYCALKNVNCLTKWSIENKLFLI